MKQLLATFLIVFALAVPKVVLAVDDYDDSQSHPLRIVAYIVHPAGFAAKWLVAWPLHYLFSRPGLDKVFGHRPHSDYAFDEDYL